VDLRKFHAERSSPDIEVRKASGFEALSKSICTADGSSFATLSEYREMDIEAIQALIAVFVEVNVRPRDGELGNG
jgi:hypothetical protein